MPGSSSWLGRFFDVRPISSEGAFRIRAARDHLTGAPVVVVSLAAGTDEVLGAQALARFHRAHAHDIHPVVARAIELGRAPEGPFVVLDCAARCDLSHLLALSRKTGARVGHGAADGFISTLRMGLVAASALPEVGPLGTLGYPSVLFAPDGQFWLIGFGHNVAIVNEYGRVGGLSTIFQAPEVAVGAPPTLSSDYVALIQFMRSLMPFIRLESGLVRVLAGNTLSEDLELLQKIRFFDRELLGARPDARASVEEALAVSQRIRELLGIPMDVEGFRDEVRSALERAGESMPRPRTEWTVARDGSWLDAAGGARIEVPSRHLARIVLALAEERLARPGKSLPVSAIVAAGWPGERMSARSGANRVYVAVSQLRKLAFARDLESHEGGYRLSLAASILVLDGPTASPPAALSKDS